MSNATHLRGPQAWLNFRGSSAGRWSYDKLILLGDAAHTAHFSIGSGTKLALEDAIKLAEVLNRPGLDRDGGARRISGRAQCRSAEAAEQRAQLDRMVRDARSLSPFKPIQFAYSLLTRSQRVSHENLRLRDPAWLEGVERWFQLQAARRASWTRCADVRTLQAARHELENRIVVSPMAMYSAQPTARPTISTSSITAPARRAAPVSSIPR
jgi:anthraniloyl-CoA monooxygenase